MYREMHPLRDPIRISFFLFFLMILCMVACLYTQHFAIANALSFQLITKFDIMLLTYTKYSVMCFRSAFLAEEELAPYEKFLFSDEFSISQD